MTERLEKKLIKAGLGQFVNSLRKPIDKEKIDLMCAVYDVIKSGGYFYSDSNLTNPLSKAGITNLEVCGTPSDSKILRENRYANTRVYLAGDQASFAFKTTDNEKMNASAVKYLQENAEIIFEMAKSYGSKK